MIPTNITANLWKLMADKGLKKLKAVSDATGLSKPTVYKFDKNENLATVELKSLLQLCELFECTVDELLNIPYDEIWKTRKFEKKDKI